jgi:predicted lipid-binding transport protein (Tim44 family)
MKLMRKVMLALFCAALAAAPLVAAPQSAEARAGWTSRGYSSMGSMGSQTYRYNGGSTINRSTTPYNSPSYNGGSRGYGGYGYGGYGGYHPFWSGLAGGMFGGWLGSMLFPHFGMGYGGGGYGYGGGWGGGLFSILIWLFLLWLGWRVFRGFFRGSFGGGFGGPMVGPGPGPGPGMGMGFGGGGLMSGGVGSVGYGGPGPGQTLDQIPISQSDQTAFEAVLKAVQGAWSKADLSTLRHYVTPEMLSYFSEELSQNQSEGLENHVEDVEFLNGDVREAWREENLEYATVAMHWRARDWTVRTDGSNAVANGDPRNPSEAQELWTFARSPNGHWLLSAIQQV